MGFRSEFGKLRFSHRIAIIVAPFLMLAIGIYMYSLRADFNMLKARGIHTIGIIGHKKVKVKQRWDLNYFFAANGKQWEGMTGGSRKNSGLNAGDSIDIVYLPENPDINMPGSFLK